MSGLARLLTEMGCEVSGSDASDSSVLEELAALGVEVNVGHGISNGADAATVLWSPAVQADNDELVAAARRGGVVDGRRLFAPFGGRLEHCRLVARPSGRPPAAPATTGGCDPTQPRAAHRCRRENFRSRAHPS